LRHHPKVLAFDFKKGTKRADKSNAIDLFVTNQTGEVSISKDYSRSITLTLIYRVSNVRLGRPPSTLFLSF
jgi:hypothetical protein